MPKKYPDHFRLPTNETLKDYKIGRELGLVDAGNPILRLPDGAETVAINDIRTKDVKTVDKDLRRVTRGLSDADYPVEGLSAVQIGHAVRMSLVPMPKDFRDPEGEERQYLTIINGEIEDIPGVPDGELIAHGCFSSNEVFTKLRFPNIHILRGFDQYGNPVHVMRRGYETAVDRHEVALHEAGLRTARVAMEEGVQLDWRPRELKQQYQDFYLGVEGVRQGFRDNQNQPDWHLPYEYDQWDAVEANEFRLADFLKE